MQILAGFLLGAAYAGAPGPVTVETLRRGLQGGLRLALAVQAGSMLGLAVYALLAASGARWLRDEPGWQAAVGLMGAAVLLGLGVVTIRDGRASVTGAGQPPGDQASLRRAFGTGAAVSLANPLDLIFWLSVSTRVLHEPGLTAPAYLGGLAAGFGLTAVAVALLAGWGRARLPLRAGLILAWVCGLAFIGFGVQLGVSIGRQWMLA
jgi:chemosensory pili system protein ChpE